MKLMKRMTAVLAGCAIAIGMTACGANNTAIVAANENTKITMGAYAYIMAQAYSSASNLVPDTTVSILSQEIDGKSTAEWMKESAIENMKAMFVVDEKAKELGVYLTDEERKNIDDQMDSVWNTSQDSIKELISFGVTKDGAKQFYLEFNTKYTKIFQTMYGEDGVKAVSFDEKKAYYIENYTDFAYLQKSVSGLSDEDKAVAKEAMDGYAATINDQSKTLEQVSEEYKTAENLTSDPLVASTANLSDSQSYSAEVISALEEMSAGEARVLDLSSGSSYMLVVKKDINAVVDEKLADEANAFQVLVEMKGDEYISDMAVQAENYTNYTLYEDVIAQFDPAVFEQTDSSSSETASVASNTAMQTEENTNSDVVVSGGDAPDTETTNSGDNTTVSES